MHSPQALLNELALLRGKANCLAFLPKECAKMPGMRDYQSHESLKKNHEELENDTKIVK